MLDRTNVKHLVADDLGGAVPLVVADLSFISLLTVAPALWCAAPTDADLVLLVKPQFEAGRDRVGKGGIVRDPAVHAAVLQEVMAGLAAVGLPSSRCDRVAAPVVPTATVSSWSTLGAGAAAVAAGHTPAVNAWRHAIDA